MKSTILALGLIAFLCGSGCSARSNDNESTQSQQAEATIKNNKSKSYVATVNNVHDGDTVRVTDTDGQQHKLRLANIDAPEINQAYGKASRDALRDMILREKVQIEVLERDQYNREVARIIHNGRDINLEQLKQGNVWHYKSIAKRQQSNADFQQYDAAETQAKAERKGLWRQNNPQAPWVYRRNSREQNNE